MTVKVKQGKHGNVLVLVDAGHSPGTPRLPAPPSGAKPNALYAVVIVPGWPPRIADELDHEMPAAIAEMLLAKLGALPGRVHPASW